MANGQLSQDQIDQLLGGRASASPPVGAAPETEARIEPYDFHRPRHVSKDRLRTLEAMYERLVKALEAWLIGRVRRQVELHLQSVEQFSFGEFKLSLPTPCASFGFDVANVPGQKGVIDVGGDFAYLLVDRFFGGADQPAIMNRALTPIERMAVRIVVERVAGLLTEIWEDFVTLELDLTTFESFPEMVPGSSRDDPVLVANIEILVGDKSSLLLLCLPLAVLDKFFASADDQRVKEMTGSDQERRATREVLEHSLRATRVDVAARLPEFRVPLRQLIGLPIGGILPTGIPVDSPLQVHVGGQARFSAASGRVGKRLAVRLLNAPKSGSAPLPAPHP